jgi:hypothetical protein
VFTTNCFHSFLDLILMNLLIKQFSNDLVSVLNFLKSFWMWDILKAHWLLLFNSCSQVGLSLFIGDIISRIDLITLLYFSFSKELLIVIIESLMKKKKKKLIHPKNWFKKFKTLKMKLTNRRRRQINLVKQHLSYKYLLSCHNFCH